MGTIGKTVRPIESKEGLVGDGDESKKRAKETVICRERWPVGGIDKDRRRSGSG